jgi:hypothetical protein
MHISSTSSSSASQHLLTTKQVAQKAQAQVHVAEEAVEVPKQQTTEKGRVDIRV